MKNDDVEDDLEELLAARARMMRSHAVALHKIAHVFDDDSPAPADWPAKRLGIQMTEDSDESLVEKALRRAHERASEPLSTPKSIADGEAFMKEVRLASIAAVRSRIERGELIPATDLQSRLNVSADWISSAVIEQRLFAICDENGHDYYPAFYADSRYDLRQLEEVAQRLGSIPPTVKYHFFFAKAHSLYAQTPLEALAAGQLDAVLRAAAMCAER